MNRFESEEKYRTLIEGLGEAVYRLSLPEGKYEYVSPSSKLVFGYSNKKFQKTSLLIKKIIHPDFINYYNEKWADLIIGKVSPTYEYKIIDPKGNERWILQSNKGIFDKEGNIIAIEGICRNITDLRGVGLGSKESKHNLSERVKELTCLYGLSQLFENLDLSLENIIHETLDLIATAWQYPKITCVRITFDKKEYKTNNFEETEWKLSTINTILEKIMNIEVYYLKNKPFLKEEEDLIDYIGNRLKISLEHKESQQKLKESEDKLRELNFELEQRIKERTKELKESEKKYIKQSNEMEIILDHIPGFVFYKDDKNNFIRVNKLIADAHNMTKEEVSGKNSFELYPKEEAQAYLDDDLEVINSRQAKLNFEELWDTPKGRRWLSTSKIPHFDVEGEITGIIGISNDITERKKVEEKLQKSENRLLKVQKIAHLGFWDLNIVTGDLYWSDETYHIFGFKPQEFVPTYEIFRRIVHPDDLDFVQKHVDAALQGNIKYKIDFRILRPNGDVHYVNAQGDVARDVTGKAIRFIGTQINITKRKRAEKALRESEERLHMIFDGSHDLISISDLNAKPLWANPAWVELFGPVSEFKEEPLKLIHPDDLKKSLTALNTLLTGECERIDIEYRYKMDNGKCRTFETSIFKIILDKEEKLCVIAHDITMRKEAEEKLKESLEVTNKILESIPIGISLISYDKKIIWINSNALNIIGASSKEEIIGKLCHNVICPSEVGACPILDLNKEIDHSEKELLECEGNRVPILKTVIPITIEGEKMLLEAFMDISKLKKIELKLKKSEEKYREAYNLVDFYKDLFAHDMNNILQAILTTSEMHSLVKNDPEKLKNFGDVTELVKMHIRRGISLISKVRTLSELKENDFNLKPITFSEVLSKSVKNTKNSFLKKNTDIQIKGLSKDLKILGDDLLIEVFDNLLNNAVKFSDLDRESIVDIIISKIQVDDIKYIKIEFKDHGIGMLDDRKLALFTEFYKRDKSKRGMGIGLSLVKKIVDRYNGKIWVEDRIKGDYTKGCNFVLLIPELV